MRDFLIGYQRLPKYSEKLLFTLIFNNPALLFTSEINDTQYARDNLKIVDAWGFHNIYEADWMYMKLSHQYVWGFLSRKWGWLSLFSSLNIE